MNAQRSEILGATSVDLAEHPPGTHLSIQIGRPMNNPHRTDRFASLDLYTLPQEQINRYITRFDVDNLANENTVVSAEVNSAYSFLSHRPRGPFVIPRVLLVGGPAWFYYKGVDGDLYHREDGLQITELEILEDTASTSLDLSLLEPGTCVEILSAQFQAMLIITRSASLVNGDNGATPDYMVGVVITTHSRQGHSGPARLIGCSRMLETGKPFRFGIDGGFSYVLDYKVIE